MYNSLSYKSKQFFWLLIKLSIVIGCGYFIYNKLIENDQLRFSDFYETLIEKDVFSLKNILQLFIFSFLNWFLEILKWNSLVNHIQQISFSKATVQSFASLTTSLITPNRIGEYGAKALYFEKSMRKKILGLNLVGNFYQMTATLFFGIIGFVYFVIQHNVSIDFHRIFRFVLLSLFVITAFFFGAKHFNYKGYSFEKARSFINKIPFKLNLKVGVISFLRFVIFSHQFYFLILVFNFEISYLDTISAIVSIYFIASIVPMLSLFDVILKGSIAIWIFSFFKIEPIAILSITTIMWILNFAIPALIGCYFVLTFKPKFDK